MLPGRLAALLLQEEAGRWFAGSIDAE